LVSGELSKRETLTEKLAALRVEMSDLDTTLATHYRAALNGGWTAKELASAGIDVPKTATRQRAPKPRQQTTTPEAPVGGDVAEPQAPAA